MLLSFDTETTHLVNHKQDAHHPSQPHLVQLAAILTDDKAERELASMNVIIKPDGWEVSVEASNIHGITHERAMDEGIRLADALDIFDSMCECARTYVCHNVAFDSVVIEAQCHRLDREHSLPLLSICTMKSTTDYCNIPGKWGKPKWPTLMELHTHLFGEGFEKAHDALFDLRATLKCLKELFYRGVIVLR